MEIYVKSYNTFRTLGMAKLAQKNTRLPYEISINDENTIMSNFYFVDEPFLNKNNYLVVNGLYKQFLFIIVGKEKEPNTNIVLLKAKEIKNVFSRKIYDNGIVSNVIEENIKALITQNFTDTDDGVFNLNYIRVETLTQTQGTVATNAEDKLYNLHTYINNCRQYKKVYTEASVTNTDKLKITIKHKEPSAKLRINTDIVEVINKQISEIPEQIGKVEVYTRSNNSKKNYYLNTSGEIIENKDDPNRMLNGVREVISVEKEEEAFERASEVFRSNKFNHSFEFEIPVKSKLINIKEIHVGEQIEILIDGKVYSSYIDKMIIDNPSTIKLKAGGLKTLLTEKINDKPLNIGSRLDVSGGNIEGNLTINNGVVLTENNFTEYITIPEPFNTQELEQRIDNKIDTKLDKSGGNIEGNLTINDKKVALEQTIATYGRQHGYDVPDSDHYLALDYYPKFSNSNNYSEFFMTQNGKLKVKKNVKVIVSAGVFINCGHGYLYLKLRIKRGSNEFTAVSAFDDGGSFKQATIARMPIELQAGDELGLMLEVPFTSQHQKYHIRGFPDNYFTIETI